MFTFPLTSDGWSLWAPASLPWTPSLGFLNILPAEQVIAETQFMKMQISWKNIFVRACV